MAQTDGHVAGVTSDPRKCCPPLSKHGQIKANQLLQMASSQRVCLTQGRKVVSEKTQRWLVQRSPGTRNYLSTLSLFASYTFFIRGFQPLRSEGCLSRSRIYFLCKSTLQKSLGVQFRAGSCVALRTGGVIRRAAVTVLSSFFQSFMGAGGMILI